jgi:predicted DNA-binding mobile mystery protein A
MEESWRGLEDAVAGFQAARQAMGGQRKWLRAMRRALGISAAELARSRGVRVREIFRLEDSEREGGVTVRALRQVAEAMDCELVYAVVPQSGSLEALALRTWVERETRREKEAFEKKCAERGIVDPWSKVRLAFVLEMEKHGISSGPRRQRGRRRGWKRQWGRTRLGRAEMLEKSRALELQRKKPGRHRGW